MGNDETFSWPDDWEKAIPAVTRLVHSFCRRRGLPEADTADLLQCVLTRLLIEATVNTRHFASLAPLCVWLRMFLATQFKRHVQRQSREQATDGLDPATAPGAVEAEDITPYLQLLDDPREREVLNLCYVEGLTLEKIGQRLGFSTAQAHKLRKRALATLKRRLSK